jgi:hypothetical protein
MASILKVDKLDPQSGTALEIGSSGDTITIPSGATFTQSGTMNASAITAGTLAIARGGTGAATFAAAGLANTPAFEAYLSADQALSDSTVAKVQFNTEEYDTDGDYDNSSNYRFTPTTAGKYYVYTTVYLAQDTVTQFKVGRVYIYKNGAGVAYSAIQQEASFTKHNTMHVSSVQDMDGSSDYVEIYAYIAVDSVANNLKCDYAARTLFGAYRIIGA